MLVLRAAQGRAQEGLMLLRSRADAFAQELQVNRLAEVFCELCPAASPGGPRLVERADDEHGDVPSRGLRAEDLADRKTVEVRQHQVEQDDIGQRRPGQVERCKPLNATRISQPCFARLYLISSANSASSSTAKTFGFTRRSLDQPCGKCASVV